jgi:hypothetical protein
MLIQHKNGLLGIFYLLKMSHLTLHLPILEYQVHYFFIIYLNDCTKLLHMLKVFNFCHSILEKYSLV